MRGFLLLFFLASTMLSHAVDQNDVLGRKITCKIKRRPMVEILKELERLGSVSFNYNNKIIPEGNFSLTARDEELNVVLVRLLSPHKLVFTVLFGSSIVINKSEKADKFTVSGYVIDESTGEKLIGVSVFNLYDLKSTTTNQDGYYSLTLLQDSVKLKFYQTSYAAVVVPLFMNKNQKLNIQLKDDPLILPPVSLNYSLPENQENFKIDELGLTSRNMKKLPFLFGETDVLKGLQLLPGVSSGNDGTIGLNIRGGGPDQNLILLDDVPLYNPSHLYGFFSVFNSDVIKDVKLLKGGISARYSGRLSSVVDVRTKDGNNRKINTQFSLGLLSTKLTVDGPIGKKKKTTFILSGRRSLFDAFYGVNFKFNGQEINPFKTGYYFYDANGKINHEFSDKHQLSVGFYTGLDNVFIKNSFSLKDPDKVIKEKDNQNIFWGNHLVSIRDHHVWSPRLSGRFNLSYTNYNFGNRSDYEYTESNDSTKLVNSYNYQFESIIRNTMVFYHAEYKAADWLSIKSGVGGVYHEFERRISSSDNIINTANTDRKVNTAIENNVYTELKFKTRQRLEVTAGGHYAGFQFSSQSYHNLQPRFSADYKLSKHLLLHGAYQKTLQFLHLLTSTNSGMPLDLWLPSTDDIKPESASMFSGGISFAKGAYVINLEGFNKRMNNLIEYKDQANYIGTDVNWEEKVTTGSGLAYGYELLAEKRNGKTQGWISYTLSWNNRKFDLINGGRVFPYKYDRRHNLAFFVSHTFNSRVDASLNWVFSSGANYTLPEQVYFIGSGLAPSNIIYVYGDRNNFKFPNYHRLDFGINFKKNKRKYTRVFSVGAYNVYNRLNPFYVTLAYDGQGKRVFEAVSLFPVLPSVNYKIQF